MKKVRIYRPKVSSKQQGQGIIRVIDDKRHELIAEKAVMDKTLELYQNADDDFIINTNMYMEEVGQKPENDEPSKRWKLDDIIEYMIENEIEYDPSDKKEVLLKKIADFKSKQ